MNSRWAPRPVRDDGDDPVAARTRWRHTALYVTLSWLGYLVGFLAFEAVAPGAVSAAIPSLFINREWSSAWVLVGCCIVVAFVGAVFGTAYEQISKRREP
jgi:hypothetical protein